MCENTLKKHLEFFKRKRNKIPLFIWFIKEDSMKHACVQQNSHDIFKSIIKKSVTRENILRNIFHNMKVCENVCVLFRCFKLQMYIVYVMYIYLHIKVISSTYC